MSSHSRLTNWLWRHFHNYFLKRMHSLSIVDFWKKKYGLISQLHYLKFNIEFHSKIFIMTNHELKNEIIKLNVNFFLWNLNQMVVVNFWSIKNVPCFQESFLNDFFLFIKKIMPNEYIIEIFNCAFICMDFMGFKK